MVLLVTESGTLGTAIAQGLAAAGHEVATAGFDDELYQRASGKSALVYVPFRRSLDAVLVPRPDVERARRVLGASNAPGVEVVVFVLPRGDGYAAELEALRRYGVPYVVVRTPPVLEEVADELAADRSRSIWVPREGNVEVARASAVADAVVEAVATEDQGSDLLVTAAALDAATLFTQAATLAGDVRVHPVRPRIFRTVRPIARWVRRGEPVALRLWDDLSAAVAQPLGAAA